MKKSLKFYLGLLVFSLIISIPLLIPYIHSGYFPTHDGEWAVVRLADMFREIRDFQLPPRYSGNLNFGYGYPLFNFAYPFPYYVGLIVHLLGLGFVSSIKFVFALTIPISAFFMFLASRNIWKNDYAGLVSSVLYLYFPYHLVDLFVRGSIGESVAFALFPIILFSLSKLINNPKLRTFEIIGAFSYAALIVTHNIMAVLFSLTLLIYFLGSFATHGKKILRPFLFMGFFGFVLSAFFFVPALLEKHNILLSVVPIENRNLFFVSFKQLLFSPWGYGVPTDPKDGFTYQLGWPFLVVLVALIGSLLYQFSRKVKRSSDNVLATVFLAGALILGLFLFSFSKILWKLPLLSEINFPWTMLSQLGLILSLLAGYLTKFKYTKIIAFAALFMALIIYIPLAKPQSYIDKGDGYYFTNDATTTSSDELMPLWVKSYPNQRPDKKVLILNGQGSVSNIVFNSKKISFSVNNLTPASVRINTIYYPGWKVMDNGTQTLISYNNRYGVMDINLGAGNHMIIAKFSETPLRLVSDLISLLGLLVLVFLLVKGLSIKSYVRR